MFKSIIAPLLFCGSVLAQSVSILSPSKGQVVVPGQNVTVQLGYAVGLLRQKELLMISCLDKLEFFDWQPTSFSGYLLSSLFQSELLDTS
jgi:hypothetical protein